MVGGDVLVRSGVSNQSGCGGGAKDQVADDLGSSATGQGGGVTGIPLYGKKTSYLLFRKAEKRPEEFDNIDVFVLMQVHEKDVYNEANLKENYKDYKTPFEMCIRDRSWMN